MRFDETFLAGRPKAVSFEELLLLSFVVLITFQLDLVSFEHISTLTTNTVFLSPSADYMRNFFRIKLLVYFKSLVYLVCWFVFTLFFCPASLYLFFGATISSDQTLFFSARK